MRKSVGGAVASTPGKRAFIAEARALATSGCAEAWYTRWRDCTRCARAERRMSAAEASMEARASSAAPFRLAACGPRSSFVHTACTRSSVYRCCARPATGEPGPG